MIRDEIEAFATIVKDKMIKIECSALVPEVPQEYMSKAKENTEHDLMQRALREMIPWVPVKTFGKLYMGEKRIHKKVKFVVITMDDFDEFMIHAKEITQEILRNE